MIRPTRGRRAALGLATLMVLLLALPRPVAAQESPGASISFLSASPYVAQAGGIYALKFGMEEAPADSVVTFTVSRSLTVQNDARKLFDEWVAGTAKPDPIQNKVSIPAAAFVFAAAGSASSNYTAELAIAQGGEQPERGFTLTDPGVYPLAVALSAADGTTLDSFTTFMIVLAANTVSSPMALAPILPLTAPVSLQPDGLYVLTDDDGRRLSGVQKVLADHPAASLTIDPTPETIDALGHPTAATAPTPTQIAAAIGNRPVLAGSYVDLDVNAWSAAGLTGELAGQLTLGSSVLETTVAGGRPLESGTWIAREDLTADALDQLKSVGIDRLVLPTGTAGLDQKVFDGRRNSAAQFAEQQPFDVENDAGGRFRAVSADARLATRLTATPNAALNAQYALADLALLYCGPTTATKCQSLPNELRGVALDVPDTATSLASFGALLSLIATSTDGLPTPMVKTTTLRELLDRPPATSDGQVAVRAYNRADPTAVPSMTGYRDGFRRLEPMVGGYQSMVMATGPELGTAMRRLLDVSGAAMPAERQDEYLASVDAQLGVVTQAITAPPQEPATLTASDAVIQVRVDNQLSYPVTIRLELSSDKLEFTDGKQRATIDQVLAPKTTTGVKVDVRARASGTFSLDTRITSPDGSLNLAETSLEVRSTAVSQLGLVLTISAGFFLLAWWIKHFRATRRARKLVDPGEAEQHAKAAEREHEPA